MHVRSPRRPARATRAAVAAALSVASLAAFLAIAQEPAKAATQWFVGGGTTGTTNAATCGTTASTACDTLTRLLQKPAASFAPGDTVALAAGTYVDHPNITRALTIDAQGPVTFSGGGTSFAVAVNANTTFNGPITFSGGRFQLLAGTPIAGGVAIGSGHVVLNGSTVSGNTSPATGGNGPGIYLIGGSITLDGVTVKDNGDATTLLGGAMYLSAGTSATITDSTFQNNKAWGGGAIYAAPGAQLSATRTTFVGNTATAPAGATGNGWGVGGAVFVGGRATTGAVAPAATATFTSSTFDGNIATFTTSSPAPNAGNGGAIYNSGTLDVSGGAFIRNRAVASTGGGNRSGWGGAILNSANDADDTPSASITGGTTFTGGLAPTALSASAGGAVANLERVGNPTAPVLEMSADVSGFRATNGGAIYNGGTATLSGTYSGNVAEGAVASGNGGAVYNTAELTTTNAAFTGNVATSTNAGFFPPAGWGGAIFSLPSQTNVTPSLTLTDTTIDGTAGGAFLGGGIANVANLFGFAGASSSELIGTRLSVTNASAPLAGGIYTSGPTTLTDSSVLGNKATNASLGLGGGVYLQFVNGPKPTVTLDGTEVGGNTAAVSGGGIVVGSNTTLVLEHGADVHGNQAVQGGGITAQGTVTSSSSSISGNNASFIGGGLQLFSAVDGDAPTATLTDTTVDGNTAAFQAGNVAVGYGVAAGNPPAMPATLTATGGAISHGSAPGAGGAYVAEGSTMTLDGTDLLSNTATGWYGGAVWNAGSTTVRDAEVDGNVSKHDPNNTAITNTGLGGAFYSASTVANTATRLVVEGSSISNNEGWGGAVLVSQSSGTGSTNQTSIDRSTIHANRNTTNVGSIVPVAAALSITNSTITGNTITGAANLPSVLYQITPTPVTMAGTILSGNAGVDCTSAVPVNDGGYNIGEPGDTSCGFSAAKHDRLVDPQLGPLQRQQPSDPTPTRLPGAASPALDVIPVSTATGVTDAVSGAAVVLCAPGSTDQRGASRPQGATCDVGAVEALQVAPEISGPDAADYTVTVLGTPIELATTGSPTAHLSISGDSLPSGVTFHDNGDGTATISGTPIAGTGGEYHVTVTATNEAGSDAHDLTLRVHQAPTLAGPTAATYTVGAAGAPLDYHTTAGYPGADLSVDGALPAGVTFTPGPEGSGTGTIGGTPAAGTGGVYSIAVTAHNDTQPDATVQLVLTVNEGPGTITGPTGDTFTVGVLHQSADFAASGTPAPTFTATGLPEGLSIVSTGPGTAAIRGTAAPGTGGDHPTVTVHATNGVGVDASTTFHLVVHERPDLTGPSSARFVAGTDQSIAFATVVGYPTAEITRSGALPAGLTFADNGNGTATIAGVADEAAVGTYHLTLTATNAAGADSVELDLVVVPPLSITTGELPGGSVGDPYAGAIEADGGQTPYAFSVAGGSLPAGLTLHPDGTITGTPTAAGTSTFTVEVTDAANPPQTDTREVSITIAKGTTTLSVAPVVLRITKQLGISVNVGYLSARLTGGADGAPLPGQTVAFTLPSGGPVICTAVTDSQGVATCAASVTQTVAIILNLGVRGTYAGSAPWSGSTGTAGIIGS